MGPKLAALAIVVAFLAGCGSGEQDAPVPKATTAAATKPPVNDPSPLPAGLQRNIPGG